MTKKELINALHDLSDDRVIVCMDESGGWGNIVDVSLPKDDAPAIIYGGSPAFCDE